MFDSEKRRLRADLAEERRLHDTTRQRLAEKTTECASWKHRSQVAGDHAALVIERTRERDEAVRELARIRGGGLYRQIRAAANAEVANGYGRAVRDFARDLETWLPEDTSEQPATDPCTHGCRDAADEHTRLSQELDAEEVRP